MLYKEDGSVKRVATRNKGVKRDGDPGSDFQLGMALHAKYTLFAEGSRGHLGKQLMAKYDLNKGRDPQTYGIGIKELWEIDPSKHRAGLEGSEALTNPHKFMALAAEVDQAAPRPSRERGGRPPFPTEVMVRMINRELGKSLSLESVRRIMKLLGFSAQNPLYQAWQQDPVLVQQWEREAYPAIEPTLIVSSTVVFDRADSRKNDFDEGDCS